MSLNINEIEALLPGYLTGELSEEDSAAIDSWRAASPENEAHFLNSLKAWESIPLLHEMEQFNSFEALNKIQHRIRKSDSSRFSRVVKIVAAIFFLPLLCYSGYVTYKNFSLKKMMEEHVVMQTISSRQGMVSQFQLADGTRIWLNSGSELQFPTVFTGDFREVKLTGEAYFEVAKNRNQPFRVNAKELKVEVTGTSFDVASYREEKLSEVILVEGSVNLTGSGADKLPVGRVLQPGQRGVYNEVTGNIRTEEVSVDKYISWREGNLIFRDDKMEEVVKRLSRWFNVEIMINDPEIKSYIYKATFRNENLLQVLNLLKISAPIDFAITERKALQNGEFTKQKVYLMKKKI
ncbi:MAG TPA: FecR domain-containing protein [Prolixibacteraceae bacterium]|nr:FecR domain-containing protein [Prolixibacteraceae bacterium]